MTLGLLSACLVSFVWILSHMLLMHVRPAENRIRSITLGYVLSLPLVYVTIRYFPWHLPDQHVLVSQAWRGPHPLQPFIHGYVFHLLVFFLYVECFYHVERAVTLRFLIEIMRQPGGAARLQDIMKQYNVREMVERRLTVLEEHHFIRRDGEVWCLKPKGRLFARAMQFSNFLFKSQGQSDRL